MTRARQSVVGLPIGSTSSTCSKYRVVILLAILVMGWVSVQLKHFKGTDGILILSEDEPLKIPSASSIDKVEFKVPSVPDTAIAKQLQSIIPDGSPSPLEACRPTSQILVQVRDNPKKWILQSYNEEGMPKNRGGDEFYITWKDQRWEDGNQHPCAVAITVDRNDGTYELDFVTPPLWSPSLEILPSIQDNRVGGNLTIHLQYTCGIGNMPPPSKDNWAHGGALFKRFSMSISRNPTIRKFEPPRPIIPATGNTLSLSNYEQVLVFGDSAMRQFVKNASRVFEPNIVYRTKRRKPWTMALIDEHLTIMKKQLGRDLEEASQKPPHLTALLLGSSIWDVLASSSSKEDNSTTATTTSNSVSTNPDLLFSDHLNACQYFINSVRHDYPNVDILWKSPTAMHIHVVDPSNPVNAVKKDSALLDRVRYMSSSRMAHLYRLQQQLMQELRVPFLDIYEATYLSASWTFPGDGRHYVPDLHKHMLRWFYSTER